MSAHNIFLWKNKKKVSKNYHQTFLLNNIGLDKSGYQVNNFLISQRKYMLWVLIRNEYTQHMFLLRNKKNIDMFWLKKAPYQELC